MADLEWLKKFADEATHVQRLPFIITTSLFLAIAIISFIFRILLRIRHENTLGLNDYILLFGFICLIAGTAVMHVGLWDTYFALATSSDVVLAAEVSSKQLTRIISQSITFSEVFQCLLWTSIFAVKFSLLSFFQQFMSRTGRAVRMYWIAICMITGFCWAYMMGMPFIACPYSGYKLEQCNSSDKERLLRVLSYISTAADCFSTTLLLSLSFFVLRRVRLVLYQILSVGAFACLCAALIAVSIVRVVVYKNPHGTTRDVPLQNLLLFLEGCAALVAISMVAFPTLYNQHYETADKENRLKWSSKASGQPRKSTESEEQLNLSWRPDTALGIETSVKGACTPKIGSGDDSVLMTREVRVVSHYEPDLEKNPWAVGTAL